MRRTGQSVCGHPHAAAVFPKRSRNASGSSCGPIFCTGMWVGGAGTVGFSPARTSRSIQLRNSSRSSRWFWTRAQNLLSWSALMSISALCCSWWSPASDWMTSANGDPDGEDMMAAAFRLPFPGFGTSVTKFVGRKEADRVGSWRLRYVYLRQINSHRCALCVTRKHQLSRSSPRSLSVFVPTVSLWQLVRSSLHSVSLSELPFHGGFYPVSTPITTIRHRWSSFCTWPTYLPLSPESFSRCRLRWTTPPSPHIHFGFMIHKAVKLSLELYTFHTQIFA